MAVKPMQFGCLDQHLVFPGEFRQIVVVVQHMLGLVWMDILIELVAVYLPQQAFDPYEQPGQKHLLHQRAGW